MIKMDTIAATMRKFMESSPSVTIYPTYKALNDAVGAVHGKAEGKVQELAGEKAWVWTPDPISKTWRKATEDEIATKRAAAAGKAHGTRSAKVLSDEDRAALDAQVTALKQVANPALAPLLADLQARQASDDVARRGTLKDRLAKAIDKLSMEHAVELLEAAAAAEPSNA